MKVKTNRTPEATKALDQKNIGHRSPRQRGGNGASDKRGQEGVGLRGLSDTGLPTKAIYVPFELWMSTAL